MSDINIGDWVYFYYPSKGREIIFKCIKFHKDNGPGDGRWFYGSEFCTKLEPIKTETQKNEVKVGEEVICIDASHSGLLQEGKKYKILYKTDIRFKVKMEAGFQYYSSNRFAKISQTQNTSETQDIKEVQKPIDNTPKVEPEIKYNKDLIGTYKRWAEEYMTVNISPNKELYYIVKTNPDPYSEDDPDSFSKDLSWEGPTPDWKKLPEWKPRSRRSTGEVFGWSTYYE